jgi:hypothetical protein
LFIFLARHCINSALAFFVSFFFFSRMSRFRFHSMQRLRRIFSFFSFSFDGFVDIQRKDLS